MSQKALQDLLQAKRNQNDRFEARRIYTKVDEARGDINGSGPRWPFELTQNAHDSGARPGAKWVNINLQFDGRAVTFDHDGRQFSMDELSAMLSGGSSKGFQSEETTGRFGTGLLVSHVLSPIMQVTGIVDDDGELEQFTVRLDRSGDENQIIQNTCDSYEAIQGASSIDGLDGRRTAIFLYDVDKPEAARMGLDAYLETLPYLYGTCPHLGTVTVTDEEGISHKFEPGEPLSRAIDELHLREREIITENGGGRQRRFRVIRLQKVASSCAAIVVVLEQIEGQWHLAVPREGFARLFCRFPIRNSNFIPINTVIDGRFDLRQERNQVLMKDGDKEQIAEAIGLLPMLVQLALKESWGGGHKLARMGMPDTAFGEKLDEQQELREWWRGTLAGTAQAMAAIPIVQTSAGLVKASGPAPVATFVVPRFGLEEKDEFNFGDVWELARELRDTYPPVRSIASDWSSIAAEWTTLNVSLQRVALTEVADAARCATAKLEDLRVTTEPLSWLARFLNLVGEAAGQHNCDAVLAGLIPNQNKMLKSPASLRRDKGIKTELKNLAATIGLDVRDRLLLQDLVMCGEAPTLPHLEAILNAQVTQTLDESAVIKELIDELNKQLPDNKPVPEEKRTHCEASIDLLKYLWENQVTNAALISQKCPLVASDNTIIHWTIQRRALAPVSVWHPSAKPFAKLYEDDQVLAEDYVVRAAGTPTIVDALVKWDIAFPGPLYVDRHNLRDEKLKPLAVEGEDCTNVAATDMLLSQIALLPSQLIQRCQSNEELAKLLLGLTLRHIATNDTSWREIREIPARKDRTDIKIKVRPSLWLADLRSKAWVPVRGEKDGQTLVQPVIADAGNLRPLIDSAWLIGNDAAVELLSSFFGFKALELRLLSTVPLEEERGRVENELAKIVQVLGGDPGKYGELAAGLADQKKREEEKVRNRKFGLAVQEAIERCLSGRGLRLKLIDRGYDYDIYVQNVSSVDAGTHHFTLADYLLEVKATTTGEVRLTPPQARTASKNPSRFMLCVVDLRGVTSERMQAEWSEEDVEPRAHIFTDIGSKVGESHGFVEMAKDCEVGLRNDDSLRYGVPVSVWEQGSSIADWVAGLSLPAADVPRET